MLVILASTLAMVSTRLPASAAAPRVSKMVTATTDDARSRPSGTLVTSETAIPVGTGDGQHANVVGFRFAHIAIPAGAFIDTVNFSLAKSGSSGQRLVVDLAFEAADNAGTFSNMASPASRVRTSTGSHVDNTTRRVNGTRYQLGDTAGMRASLQEVINRTGWLSGNSLVLIAYGPATPSGAHQSFSSYDGNPASAAKLIVTYHVGGPDIYGFTYARNVPWTTKPSWTKPAGAPTPVAGQDCPAWVHDRYATQAPDGKYYPTWHAPTDPQYGCHFGHEHGDDPTGAAALRGRTIPFGYVGIGIGHYEAHPGFKIYVVDLPHGTTGVSTHETAHLVVMIHQGSSNNNAFTEPRHEVHYHYWNPADGREVHVMMIAMFGDLKIRNCATGQFTVIHQRPGAPGVRMIPGQQCTEGAPFPSGSQYEDWETALYVGAKSDRSQWRAYIDPHFAVFNPGRYCNLQADNTCQLGYSESAVAGGPGDPASTSSMFKGDHREMYINAVALDNAGHSTDVWTDAFGVAVPVGTPGAIKQYVSAVDFTHTVNSVAVGANTNHDPDGSVRLPN